jgi:CubicO group peptidase (beta-lactamase class C family)
VFGVIAAARRTGRTLSLLTMYQDDSLAAVASAIDRARPARIEVPGDVPGASIAVIRNGALAEVRIRGEVTTDTIFQVGSLSKPVTAFAVLRLVEQGVLDLDEDVNGYLTGWSAPASMTLRHLLSHMSGLEPTPSTGHPRGKEVPALVELLAATRLGVPPGTLFRKANIHYSVVQQLLVDVTGRSFAELMRDLVFTPLGMTNSGFGHTFPDGRDVAPGHDEEGRPIDGGWLLWPDEAAAGLWTTSTDLAVFLLEIRKSYLGEPGGSLPRELAREMLTPQHRHTGYGLGVVVDDFGTDVQFGHGGTGGGYHAMAMCRIGQGTGFVALTNSDAGASVIKKYTSLLDGDL